jgi:tRNA uridine 5-carbamoylmethylation protein Kti12
MKVFLLIGLPGSGKSTWAKNYVNQNENAIIVSQDAFRYMIKGNNYIFDNKYENFIKSATDLVIQEAIEHNFDLIVDETHIKKLRRLEVTNLINEIYMQYKYFHMDYSRVIDIIYLWFNENNNLENRMKDDRGYTKDKWNEIIERMKTAFEPPTEDEHYKIIKINNPTEYLDI